MDLKEFEKIYIYHYLLLEEDFKDTIKYVSVSKENFNAYSSAYLKLLLAIGGEIDCLLPFLARLYDPKCKEDGYGCSKTVLRHEPNFKEIEFFVDNYDIILKPWYCDKNPNWWTIYNELKHNRAFCAEKIDPTKKYYQLANLENVINALAGLFALELFVYRKLAIDGGNSLFVPYIKTIFTTKSLYWKDIDFGNGMICIDKCLHIK